MNSIRTRLTIAAGVAIIALTAGAFWLSYAHLHDVAATYGLGGSTARAWAWPATLDLFIVAGEIMMLVAALDKRRDAWAIGLTVVGAGGSVALNVLGVGAGANTMTYVVAAVPPAAALLAFGALMRQIHRAIAEPAAELTGTPIQGDQPLQGRFVLGEPASEEGIHDRVSRLVADVELANLGHGVPQYFTTLETLEAEEASEEAPQPDEEEDASATVTAILRPNSKPSLEELNEAADTLRADGRDVNGPAFSDYFGVSPRTGRRYLQEWTKNQKTKTTVSV